MLMKNVNNKDKGWHWDSVWNNLMAQQMKSQPEWHRSKQFWFQRWFQTCLRDLKMVSKFMLMKNVNNKDKGWHWDSVWNNLMAQQMKSQPEWHRSKQFWFQRWFQTCLRDLKMVSKFMLMKNVNNKDKGWHWDSFWNNLMAQMLRGEKHFVFEGVDHFSGAVFGADSVLKFICCSVVWLLCRWA